MKKVTLMLVMSLLCSISVIAQNPAMTKGGDLQANTKIPRDKENVLKLKMEYFRNNFKVNEEKAEKFWTIFDEFLKTERKIHEETKKVLEEKGIKKEKGEIDFANLKDEQIYFYYDNQFKQKEKLAENEQKFYQQMKELLSAQEVVEFYRLEKEFKKEVSQEVRKKEVIMEKGKLERMETEKGKSPVSKE